MSKSTRYTVEERVTTMLKYICRGWTREEIITYVLKNHSDWAIGSAQIINLWKKANAYRNEKVVLNRDYYLRTSLSRMNDLYNLALKDKDKKFAAYIDQQIQDLLSLKEAYSQDIVGGNSIEGVVDFRFETVNVKEAKGEKE